MLNIVLSHWVMYLYLPAIVILFVLLIVYRAQSVIVYRKLRRVPGRTLVLASRWRPRLRRNR